ncbi:MAG: glucose 1-dehydrogenase [Betaproteobacteria bacterium]|nr:glucose 1-dehydrogenase [Gammaproteobacteria bacterium]MDH3437669.1 glucose 1-dehydrogenase [Betaproteobacteria bacterium]
MANSPQKAQSRPRALVTGAARGLGAAIAVGLARDGFDIALTATNVDRLADTVAAVASAGCRVVPLALDVRSVPSVEQAVAKAIEALGGLDVLVNNAGITARTPALDVTLEEWNEILRVNVTGVLLMSQQVARHLVATKREGCIINIASTHGLIGFPQRLSYGTSKGALIQMTRMLAIEWAPLGIRVNAIAPGTVETASRLEYFAANPAARDAMIRRVPSGRFCTPEEIAGAVCYLASPAAAYVTGQTLIVDGGLTAA